MGQLDLTRQAGHTFSKDQFLRVLQDGILVLSRKYPVLQTSETFTTTAGQYLYTLDTTVRPFNILDVKTDWANPLRRLPAQEMRDFAQQATNDRIRFPFEVYADQPTYWTFHPNASSAQLGDVESPGSYVEIQESSKVVAGKTVCIRYSYIPRLLRLADKTDTIDVGEEYELLLKNYVAWKLAIRYRPDLIQVMQQEYDREVYELQAAHRRRMQSSEVDYTHRLVY